MWAYKTVLPKSQVQKVSPEQIEAYVLKFYARLMRRLLADKACIPAENLVEVRFEDLEAAPMEQLHSIYEGLGLPGFARAELAFRAYLASVANYQKNRYELTDETIVKVNDHWRFALEALGYPLLEPSSPPRPKKLRRVTIRIPSPGGLMA